MSNKLIKNLKNNNQDFEFYPTTDEIIQTIFDDMMSFLSERNEDIILDIGAGNGKVLKRLYELVNNWYAEIRYANNIKLQAIEKSGILINELLNNDITVIGTDLFTQSLIDKKVKAIFTNPPYSCYNQWMEKVLNEANADFVYAVIPKRWKENRGLLNIIEKREIPNEILGTFSFENSEDRKARAIVDVVKFNLRLSKKAFNHWFDTNFNIDVEVKEKPEYALKNDRIDEINALVKGKDIIDRLLELYNEEFQELLSNYKKLEGLNGSLLKELGVNLYSLRDGLQSKIEGLKYIYWKTLFQHCKPITSRLTKKYREQMLYNITANSCIDFTKENITATILYIIKNANQYYNNQLIEFFKGLTNENNIKLYKSNQHFNMEDWRYLKLNDNNVKYVLDYRLIDARCNVWEEYIDGLKNFVLNELTDMLTIANNLGFPTDFDFSNVKWEYGKTVEIYSRNELLISMKIYKNSNIHYKFNQKFMKKLNVNVGRILGWIHSPQEASKEFTITQKEATEYFDTNFKVLPSNNITKLLS